MKDLQTGLRVPTAFAVKVAQAAVAPPVAVAVVSLVTAQVLAAAALTPLVVVQILPVNQST